MRIRVTSVTPTVDGGAVASFSCSIGAGIGLWCGRLLPDCRDYDAEFNVDKVLALHRDAQVEGLARRSWTNDGNTNILRGVVEVVDEDGVITLRLAADCITLLEFESIDALRAGQTIAVRASSHELSVWPIGF